MSDNWPCPVCGTDIKVTHQSTLDGTLAEQDEECPNGCWASSFLYGSHQERIGEEVWTWYCTESNEDCKKRRQEMKLAWEKLKNGRNQGTPPT